MKTEEFNDLLNRRLALIQETLAAKGTEYASEKDRLHNFKRAAEIRSQAEEVVEDTPGGALLGMLIKHWVSIEDIVRSNTLSGGFTPPHVIDEKLGDAINYLILLEAILKEAK